MRRNGVSRRGLHAWADICAGLRKRTTGLLAELSTKLVTTASSLIVLLGG